MEVTDKKAFIFTFSGLFLLDSITKVPQKELFNCGLPSEVKNNDSKFHFIENCPSVEIAFAVYLY
jgi:hypothetical protein